MKHLLAIACATLFATAVSAAETPALVLLPFEDLSGSESGAQRVAALVEKAATAKGWRVVGTENVDALLEKARVRYLDSFDEPVRKSILDASGTTAILTGTIYRFAEGRNPVVAVSARLVRADGTLAWADVAALTSDDTEGLFGFGKKPTAAAVAESAVGALMRRFPAPGATSAAITSGPSKHLFGAAPSSVLAPDALPRGSGRRICILPFENASQTADGARVVTDLLAIRLAASGDYTVVEPAIVRAAALEAHIGSFTSMSPDALAKLAAAVGTPLFVRGTVFRYVDPALRGGVQAELDIELSMINVADGRIVWASQHARSGSDYTGLLLLGTITNSVSLTDHVVSEMVRAELRAASRGGTIKSARSNAKRNPEGVSP